LIISATRLLVVSDYNTTTATAIASSGGYVNTLLGTIMPLVPIVLPYLGVLFLLYRRLLLSLLTFGAAILVSPTTLAPVISLAALKGARHGYFVWSKAHWPLIPATFIVLLVFALFATKELRWTFRSDIVENLKQSGKTFEQAAEDHGIKERTLRKWARGEEGWIGLAMLLAVLSCSFVLPYLWNVYPIPRTMNYYKALISQPWLPAERITVRSGSPIVGYTLSASDTWVIILDAYTRTIQYVPAPDVTARLVCQLYSGTLISSHSSPIVPLYSTKSSRLPLCSQPGSRDDLGTLPQLHVLEWTTTRVSTSSAIFRHVRALGRARICATNQVSAALSVELSGNPAGFRIQIDNGPLMKPGAVRFVPAGPHDTFSFTFIGRLAARKNNDNKHTLTVEWRSPMHAMAQLERATLNVQYQRDVGHC
jgi:hypothetical protein